ncbi:GNAT family N-acetyltransferase [Luteibacter aegosomatissinici]|uniref:GNAT family N-acetyltransferase n=1 Tax=Luteibacter aegosomatissinici TaxID=2911539 RepID=UPI001FFA053F|nr:GNAT family N-acetyltransferase [Luteibacter aegosomatissinici]UPG95772.1 GNAT family N-acetyltransferase [Luteibacter aegosomatissinici]
MDTYLIGHIETDQDYQACFEVMHELRPHLPDAATFAMRARRQAAQGYRLLAAWHRERAVALAGYRIMENLLYGRFLYVDDLVASEATRGQGLGGDLLAELREEGRRQGCAFLVLDTALANALGQRFYFRQGLLARGMHFSQAL